MIQDEHGCIDYDESGVGPPVVLVPGSCGTGAAWRPIISRWRNSFHCVTTSLLGYGRSTERRTAFDADISHEAEILPRHNGWSFQLLRPPIAGRSRCTQPAKNRLEENSG